jgi:prevent-host-death family protein
VDERGRDPLEPSDHGKMTMDMKQQIGAGEFKTHCLHLLDEVARRRTEIVITKRGRPVARLLPVEAETPPVFGRMRGTVEILGDIVAPTGERWHAEE